MKKFVLILILIMGFNILADEYVVVMSKKEKMTAEMVGRYNEDLNKYGEIRYKKQEEYTKIEWKDKNGSLITKLDINNDGEEEELVKYDEYRGGYLTEVIEIHKDGKDVGKIGEFGNSKYEFKDMTKRIDGNYYYMAGRFEIRPFIYKGKTYLGIESRYGNRELFLTAKLTKDYKLKEVGYFIKIYSEKAPKDIWEKYNEAMATFRETGSAKKAIDILESNKVKQMIRNKGKDISKGKYIRILNDYAYFLNRVGRKKEALPILRDVIYLSPDRIVTYYNLGNIYSDIGDDKRAKYCFWKYKSLLKEGANVPKKVEESLVGYDKTQDIKLTNITNPDYKLRWILIMSKKYDLCQDVGEAINQNVEREIKKYGEPRFRFRDQYTGKGFDGIKWRSRVFDKYDSEKRAYFDIDNDDKDEFVVWQVGYLSNIMSNYLQYFTKKADKLYDESAKIYETKDIDEWREFFEKNLEKYEEGYIFPHGFKAKELPRYGMYDSKYDSNYEFKYEFSYPYNIWPYRFEENYYLIIREGRRKNRIYDLNFIGVFDSQGEKGEHFGYYLLNKSSYRLDRNKK